MKSSQEFYDNARTLTRVTRRTQSYVFRVYLSNNQAPRSRGLQRQLGQALDPQRGRTHGPYPSYRGFA
jgi:hypothetical protein